MYSYESRVSYSETDSELNLSVLGMVNYLQDAALFEAQDGAATMEYLTERDLAWLLGSWQIEVIRMPKLYERIIISTAPYDFKGFIGYRNFMISALNGEILIKAASIWSLVNIKTVKPVCPENDLISRYELMEKIDMEYKPRKIAVQGKETIGQSVVVKHTQIDSNQHVNNAEYVNMALWYLPKGKQVRELRVEYKAPAYEDSVIIPVIYEKDSCVQVKLTGPDNEVYSIVEMSYI